MRFKPPVFKTCIFFQSIKTGLVVWGGFKLLLDLGLLIFFKVILIRGILSIYNSDFVLRPFRNTVILLSIILSLVIIDMAQHAVLVIGTLKKNVILLSEYYIFYIFWWIFVACVGTSGISFTIRDLVHFYSSSDLSILFLDLAVLILYLGLQLYIILLVRSEIIELKTKSMLENSESGAPKEDKSSTPTYTEITDGKPAAKSKSSRNSATGGIRKTINSLTTLHI